MTTRWQRRLEKMRQDRSVGRKTKRSDRLIVADAEDIQKKGIGYNARSLC